MIIYSLFFYGKSLYFFKCHVVRYINTRMINYNHVFFIITK